MKTRYANHRPLPPGIYCGSQQCRQRHYCQAYLGCQPMPGEIVLDSCAAVAAERERWDDNRASAILAAAN